MMWNFEEHLNRTAIIDEQDRKITYGQLNAYCHDIYSLIEKRCLVFCMCSNTIGSVIGYASCLQSGVVPLLLDANMKNELFLNLVETYHPQYIWMEENNSVDIKVQKINEEVFWGYKLYKTDYEEVPELYCELALLLTTSGSTGSPKLVRQSYKNIYENTSSIIQYLGIDSQERAITTLPMNYTYGLSIINTHLAVGATLLLTQKSVLQKEFWQFFNKYQATSFGGVPYTYEMLKKIRFFSMNLPCLRYMTQAGGKLNPELQGEIVKFAQSKGVSFYIMYGACEATARMAYLPPEKCAEKNGSIGIAIPGGKFELIDSQGDTINEPYAVGELLYYGENVTLGYATCKEDLCKKDERHGRLETGDMAYYDEERYYYIVGRKKRFLKVFGNRFGLDEAEVLLQQHFKEEEFACAGKDDLVYIFSTGKIPPNEIRHYISQITRIHISAFKVICLEQIPRNDAGKIQYSQLEKYYE